MVASDTSVSAPVRHARPVCGTVRRRVAITWLGLLLASPWLNAHAAPAKPVDRGFAFAVLSGVAESGADEQPLQRLLDAISRERSVAFAIYDGNLKGSREPCRDAVYDTRFAILNASRVPVFYVPGYADWSACALRENGGYDAPERLDYLRQTFLSDSRSFGATPLPLTRESEVARFRPFRENIRWIQNDAVFVALNAPSPNNRYLTAGGRNGEFEDRAIANAFWIDHAAEFARRREARALVIVVEGDPHFERREHERFAWLRFGRGRLREGFRIDQPLHDEKGERVPNVTRIAIAPRERLAQWIRITVNPARRPMFSVGVQAVPRNLPLPPALPTTSPDDVPLPPMPEIPAMPELPDPAASGAASNAYGVPGAAPVQPGGGTGSVQRMP
ncbi:MAG: hypothetical protein GAK40_01332 [Burkholderia plantarii]|nr:MAG: hypothetical protein GAK40_01332 [Burkholderia plantarii]